ncbi:MAG: hypothetical protein ACRDY7_07230 [Acidimicrobiia bacterium]
MVAIIVLSVVVWLSIPPLLSRAMARRGYDSGSWLVVGTLFGPVAVVFAAMELLFEVPEPPRILEEGRTGPGDLSVLVVVDGEPTTSPPTTALTGLGPRLRRLGLAKVLPRGGPREDERRAGEALRRAATGLAHPELALLFGRPEVAVAEHAATGGYDVVVTSLPDRLLSARLKEGGRVYWWGDDAPIFGPGRLPTARWRPATENLTPPALIAPTRPGRTV